MLALIAIQSTGFHIVVSSTITAAGRTNVVDSKRSDQMMQHFHTSNQPSTRRMSTQRSATYRRLLFLAVVCLFLFIPPSQTLHADVVLIGDSTVADVADPIVGWGEVLPNFFPSSETIHNHAVSGASSRSYHRDYWSTKGFPFSGPVMDLVSSGDYVLIQFGHNDLPGPTNRAVADLDVYKSFLTMLVSEARAEGGLPILVTPPEGWGYTGTSPNVQRQGHADAMKQVATSTLAPVIDLHQYSKDQFNSRTEAQAILDFEAHDPITGLPIGDKTHTSFTGAEIWADYVHREFATAAAAAAVPEPSPALLLGLIAIFMGGMRYANFQPFSEAKVVSESK